MPHRQPANLLLTKNQGDNQSGSLFANELLKTKILQCNANYYYLIIYINILNILLLLIKHLWFLYLLNFFIIIIY